MKNDKKTTEEQKTHPHLVQHVCRKLWFDFVAIVIKELYTSLGIHDKNGNSNEQNNKKLAAVTATKVNTRQWIRGSSGIALEMKNGRNCKVISRILYSKREKNRDKLMHWHTTHTHTWPEPDDTQITFARLDQKLFVLFVVFCCCSFSTFVRFIVSTVWVL